MARKKIILALLCTLVLCVVAGGIGFAVFVHYAAKDLDDLFFSEEYHEMTPECLAYLEYRLKYTFPEETRWQSVDVLRIWDGHGHFKLEFTMPQDALMAWLPPETQPWNVAPTPEELQKIYPNREEDVPADESFFEHGFSQPEYFQTLDFPYVKIIAELPSGESAENAPARVYFFCPWPSQMKIPDATPPEMVSFSQNATFILRTRASSGRTSG